MVAASGLVPDTESASNACTQTTDDTVTVNMHRSGRTEGPAVSRLAVAAGPVNFTVAAGHYRHQLGKPLPGDPPRTEEDPRSADWLSPVDVAAAIVTTLQQPRTIRTAIWTLWSMGQGS